MALEPSGLYMKHEFLTPTEEAELLNFVYEKKWDETMSRRVQHYGARYVYKHVANSLQTEAAEPVPKIFEELAVRAYSELFGEIPQLSCRWQVIVNEYRPRQGISKHVDDPKKFGPRIVCISLGADVSVLFRHGSQARSHSVPARSVYAMTEAARYTWTHELKNDSASTRVSITIRQLI